MHRLTSKSDQPIGIVMRIFYALLLVVSMLPNVVSAQCPGTNGVFQNDAYVYSFGSPNALDSFIGTGCTGMAAGTMAPTACNVLDLAGVDSLVAVWPNTAARTAAGTGDGCNFVCDMGANSCFVRATDGLPVELMEFNVED